MLKCRWMLHLNFASCQWVRAAPPHGKTRFYEKIMEYGPCMAVEARGCYLRMTTALVVGISGEHHLTSVLGK